jgi:ankyrin repeat protein
MYEENISKFVQNRGNPEDIIHMKTMLENGIFARVNIQDSKYDNSTALIYQTDKGTIEGMKFLLERGANPNIEWNDTHKPTALYLAIWNNEPKKVQLLLDYKADISIRNSSWDNVLEFCKKYYSFEIYELIMRHQKKIEEICLLKKINVRKKFILNPDVLRIICDFI